jgi:trans-aconitate methyltransferase
VTGNAWDVARYRDSFGFVTSYGDDVLALLDARPGESVLDLGCGTGEHAAELTARGARVVGVDADPEMVAVAITTAPSASVLLRDATRDEPDLGPFDAVFSNAALHWMQPQERALAFVRASLRADGRFVAEMGGSGNVERVIAAFRQALVEVGLGHLPVTENWFPTVGQQAALLESTGFEVGLMTLFDRPTPLGPGLTAADWCRQFRADTWAAAPPASHSELAARIDALAAPDLLSPDGWVMDYRRLRFVAVAR